MTTKLSIWQQNVNKSPTCQHNLISNTSLVDANIGIVTLQEPAINHLGLTTATKEWTVIYPSTHTNAPNKTRSVTLIRSSISTDSWNQMEFPSSDVMVTQMYGDWGKLTVFNIYNDGNSNDTISKLTDFHHRNRATIERTDKGSAHVLWMGDFNRHHPYWDDPNDTRLFTNEAIGASESLIEAVAEAGLKLALPSGIPTHKHNVTKKWTRLDQVFISDHSENILITCDTQPDNRGINTDHLPVLTELNLDAPTVTKVAAPNFRNVDWEEFGKTLNGHLEKLQPPERIQNQRQLDKSCMDLTTAIQATIKVCVPKPEIAPKTKRWWTKDLTNAAKEESEQTR